MPVERPVPLPLRQASPTCRAFSLGGCSIFVATEDGRLHLSIANRVRYPTWDEVRAAREALLPMDRWFVMVFPPPEHYVNHHPFCFHLWESRDPEGHAIWSEGAGMRPS